LELSKAGRRADRPPRWGDAKAAPRGRARSAQRRAGRLAAQPQTCRIEGCTHTWLLAGMGGGVTKCGGRRGSGIEGWVEATFRTGCAVPSSTASAAARSRRASAERANFGGLSQEKSATPHESGMCSGRSSTTLQAWSGCSGGATLTSAERGCPSWALKCTVGREARMAAVVAGNAPAHGGQEGGLSQRAARLTARRAAECSLAARPSPLPPWWCQSVAGQRKSLPAQHRRGIRAKSRACLLGCRMHAL
jgi:hypothetical protein